MEVKVGDRVSYNRGDCELIHPECSGSCFVQ